MGLMSRPKPVKIEEANTKNDQLNDQKKDNKKKEKSE